MESKYKIAAGMILIIAVLAIWTSCFKSAEKTYEINESYCNKIKTSEMRKTCLAMVEKNFSICEELLYFDRECYEKVFVLTKNISELLCKSFSDYEPKSACYVRLAEVKKNASFCENAGGSYQECSWKLAKLLKNPDLCNQIEAECEKYQCFADASGDISYCKKVTDAPEKMACYAKLQKNVSACGMYSSEYGEILYVPQCLYDLAKITKDISLCWNITKSDVRWICLADLGATEEVCNKAETQFWKDFCLVEVLINKLNK
jgi:hypothetical protein